MRVALFPAPRSGGGSGGSEAGRPCSYITSNVCKHLQQRGHEVLPWWEQPQADAPSEQQGAAAWAAALAQADVVVHVLHGHQQHARDTLRVLLAQQQQQQQPAGQPHTQQQQQVFLGISTPLTWAATPVPPASCGQAPAACGEGEAAADSVRRACLTDRDAGSRRPAAAAVDTLQLEQLVLRSHRPGRLGTAVVCPGLLYGAGEGDAQLHGLWRAAWEGHAPLCVVGPGSNRLPTLHVRDLAAFCERAAQALQQELAAAAGARVGAPLRARSGAAGGGSGRYLLAADAASVTQAELVQAIGQLLQHNDVESRPPSLTGCSQDGPDHTTSALLLLDLPFAQSQLPQPCVGGGGTASWQGHQTCPGGLLAHLAEVHAEFIASRGLAPLRILVRGPPAAGKTHLAARLAAAHGLLHVLAETILAELPHMDGDTQKAAAQQLAGREGRLSKRLMACLAQHVLARHPTAIKRGWILDGWPCSLAAAVQFTSSPSSGSSSAGSACSEPPQAAASKGRRESVANAPAAAALKRRTTGTAGNGGAAAAVPMTASPGAREARGSCPGHEGAAAIGLPAQEAVAAPPLQSPAELLPQFLLELEAPEEELLRRVKVLAAAQAAAESAAAAGSTAAASRTAAGTGSGGSAAAAGKRPLPAAGRSSAAAAAASAVVSSGHGLGSGSSQGQQHPLFAAAHNTVKDFGRRLHAHRQLLQEDAADLAAKCASLIAAHTANQQQPNHGGSEGPQPQQQAVLPKPRVTGSRLATPRNHALQLPPVVQLPAYGGFAAHFAAAGAQVVRVSNPLHEAAAAAVPGLIAHVHEPLAGSCSELPQLAVAEHAVQSVIDPPRNYDGLGTHQPARAPLASSAAGPLATGVDPPAGCAAAGAAKSSSPPQAPLSAGVAQLQAAAEELRREQAAAAAQRLSAAARPLLGAMLSSGVLQDVMACLAKTAVARQEQPCQVIANDLAAAAARLQAAVLDPYDLPVYGVQLAKVEAKAAREAARAAACAAKAARDEAARAAAAATLAD